MILLKLAQWMKKRKDDENVFNQKKIGSGELKICFNARWWSADVFNNTLHDIEVTTYIYSHKIIYLEFCIFRANVKNKHFLQVIVWPRIRWTTTPDIVVPEGWSSYTLLMLVSSLRNTGKRFFDQDR